jgi:hypothetical protein
MRTKGTHRCAMRRWRLWICGRPQVVRAAFLCLGLVRHPRPSFARITVNPLEFKMATSKIYQASVLAQIGISNEKCPGFFHIFIVYYDT